MAAVSSVITHDGEVKREYYADDDRIVIANTLDIGKTKRHIAACQSELKSRGEFSKSREGLGDKVASIPLDAIAMWKREHGFDWFRSTAKERDKWLGTEYARPFLTKARRRR